MTNDREGARGDLSRRNLLKLAVAGTGVAVAGALASPGAAAGKMSKKVVSYQDTPKGAARCATCATFQPPSACKLVEGTITPNAWCSIYVKKR
jgi:anaerobic selenocysteine-containing dehydrogenase